MTDNECEHIQRKAVHHLARCSIDDFILSMGDFTMSVYDLLEKMLELKL
mgnify:CR=1 FL=1